VINWYRHSEGATVRSSVSDEVSDDVEILNQPDPDVLFWLGAQVRRAGGCVRDSALLL
jgi:hypothetical protein